VTDRHRAVRGIGARSGSSVTTATQEHQRQRRPAGWSSAISFGVFCRSAPSTSAIMRSRKVSPGSAVIAHDDPVGQHLRAAGHGASGRRRLSRITGADLAGDGAPR
jgi:hypothetical protein